MVRLIFLVFCFTCSLFAIDFYPVQLTNMPTVIYDNDDHRDVYTDEYLMAMAALGEIDLKGIMTTYSPNAEEYDLFVKGRERIFQMAENAGFGGIPKPIAGTRKKLEKPESHQFQDTPVLDLPASDLIIENALLKSKDEPLLIISGGQLTTIANAVLKNPKIADHMIIAGIFGASIRDYNGGLDRWAWTILLSKVRVLAIPVGSSKNRTTIYQKPPHVPKEKIKNRLPQDIEFFKWMYSKRHPHQPLLEYDWDGHAVAALFCPDYVTDFKRFRVDCLDDQGLPVVIPDENGTIYEVIDGDQDKATTEIWRVFTKAAELTKE